jgi:hypothetical protein
MSAVLCNIHGDQRGGPQACRHLRVGIREGAPIRAFQEFRGDFFDDGALVLDVVLCAECVATLPVSAQGTLDSRILESLDLVPVCPKCWRNWSRQSSTPSLRAIMRSDRFEHYAHTICDKLCWKSYPDDELFANRSGGAIRADVLGQKATLDGAPYACAALPGIRAWLLGELADNHESAGVVDSAEIELTFKCVDPSTAPDLKHGVQFRGRGMIVSGADRYEVPYERYVSATQLVNVLQQLRRSESSRPWWKFW